MASEYDHRDSIDSTNKIVRGKTRERFLHIVKGNSVLDFGGGTGLDLQWLAENFSKVYFCEPSVKMRENAMHLNLKEIGTNSVVFLNDNQSDFKTWTLSDPFPEKLDGILANFAVLNNIKDISTVFQSFSSILKTGGLVVINVLNPKPFKLYKQHFLKTIFSLLFRKTIAITNKHGNSIQTIYLHSISSIKKSSNVYFDIINIKDLNGFGFICLELRKRNEIH
jgi:ubiquinone/menaquinone biosynthesis C-methylase UbiE